MLPSQLDLLGYDEILYQPTKPLKKIKCKKIKNIFNSILQFKSKNHFVWIGFIGLMVPFKLRVPPVFHQALMEYIYIY